MTTTSSPSPRLSSVLLSISLIILYPIQAFRWTQRSRSISHWMSPYFILHGIAGTITLIGTLVFGLLLAFLTKVQIGDLYRSMIVLFVANALDYVLFGYWLLSLVSQIQSQGIYLSYIETKGIAYKD